MYETISDAEVLWAIEVLETPTVSTLTESLPVSKSTIRRRLRRLADAGHVETWVTSLPQFPSAYELTDSGRAELEPALADADEIVYTRGDTRAYPLPPVDSVDGEAGPDSEVAQYFSGRPNALSDDIVLGALARAMYHTSPPEARPDEGTDDSATGGAPDHREVDYWRDLIAPDADRNPPPAEPPTPHEESLSTPVIALPAAPETLQTDVWIRTTTIASHAPCSPPTLRSHLWGLTDTGLTIGRVPDRRRSQPADGDTPVYGHLPGWWRLTSAGCARLAALVETGVAAVADP